MGFAPADLQTIESFAGQLGLPARPARDGSYSFVFEGASTLTFTPVKQGGGLVISLAWQGPRTDTATLRRCLAAGGYDPEAGTVVHPSLAADGTMLFSIRFDDNAISLPVVETCLQDLITRRARVAP